MPNDPTLDASVQWRIDHGTIELRERGYRGTAEAILDAGLATEVRRLISAGKEADVYFCEYNGAPLAVKAYRLYRTSHRGGRPIKVDTMSWLAAHEYEMLRQAWKGGVLVPTPARRVENLLSMRYLGGPGSPAPRLQDLRLEDPESVLREIVGGVEGMARAGVVHGDLSAFNVLLYDGHPGSSISATPSGWTARGGLHGSGSRRPGSCSSAASVPSTSTSADIAYRSIRTPKRSESSPSTTVFVSSPRTKATGRWRRDGSPPEMVSWRGALSLVEFFLTVTIVALAAEEAITATTQMDRFDALGDVFFWLGLSFTTGGLGAAGVLRGKGTSGGHLSLAIGTILYGLAAIAFSLAVRAAR